MRQSKKNPSKFEHDLNGRLSEKQLKAQIIFRKRNAKSPRSLVRYNLANYNQHIQNSMMVMDQTSVD